MGEVEFMNLWERSGFCFEYSEFQIRNFLLFRHMPVANGLKAVVNLLATHKSGVVPVCDDNLATVVVS